MSSEPDGAVRSISPTELPTPGQAVEPPAQSADEQRLRDLTDSVPGALYQLRVGADGRMDVLYLSEGIRELLGVNRDDGAADPNVRMRLVLPEDAPRVGIALRQSARTLQTMRVDFRVRHAGTGEVVWVRSIGQPRREADGSVIFNGHWQDITHEVEVRSQLEASQRRLREITDTLPGAVYQLSIGPEYSLRLDYVSEGLAELTGVDKARAEADFTALTDLLVAEDVTAFQGAVVELAQHLGHITVDFRFHHAETGELRWMRSRAFARCTDNGIVANGFLQDITDIQLIQAEAMAARDEAQGARERMQAIFDHTRIGIVIIDQELQFSYGNPWLRELLDTEDPQEFARDFSAFSPPTQPDGSSSEEQAAQMIRTAFDEGYNRFEWMHQTRDGRERPCEVTLTRITLDGAPHLFATMTDLRERKAAEASLREATERAHEASRAKSAFLANMSHEIRTPMNAIVGLTQLALDADQPERMRDCLGKIAVSANSLMQIINDVLDFSKIEAGKLELDDAPFDLYGVLDTLSDILGVRAAEKGLELLFDVDPGLNGALRGDAFRLGQVLLNLTANAIKFTETGQVVVAVRQSKQGRDFRRLRFTVSDTGIGIAPEARARLFESFEQADTTTTRRFGGTGLGLAISQRIVDLMDGEIGVDSVPGKGSSFHFSARFGRDRTARPRAYRDSLRGMRVLLADDNPAARAILEAHLRAFGCEVDTAASGSEAVKRALSSEENPYRLVVLDWQMPELDGVEAARRLRQRDSTQATLILMVTAYGRDAVERAAEGVAIDGILVKPVNPSLLFDTLVDALGSEIAQPPEAALAMPVRRAELLRGARLLLVEDNAINQEVAEALLRRVGAEITVAGNGREALERVRGEAFDAVLMDIQMPEMDGLEATRRIRALGGGLATLPIVAMTANAMDEDRRRCLEAGMDDHIGKPIDVERLYAVLARQLARAGLPAQDAIATAATAESTETDMASTPALALDEALARLASSRPLWEKLADRYLATERLSASLPALIAGGAYDAARRDVHNLKGVAGTLGLCRLQRLAAAVETELRAATSPPRTHLSELLAADTEARSIIAGELNRHPRLNA